MTIQSQTFPVVAIGASTGGVEAMEGFFRGIPSRPDMAFVVVTHLSPTHESLLPDILARYTTLSVTKAVDGAAIEPNRVYVMPEASILRIRDERLVVEPIESRERKPVDIFFSELSIAFGERAVGVVLSGGDADGALGLKAIKEQGGLTFAQLADGYGPRIPDMPDTAISTGIVDFALPVDEMGAKLLELAHSEKVLQAIVEKSNARTEDGGFNDALPAIYAVLRNQVGHDFSGYKTRTFIRRVQRRMQIKQYQDVDGYVAHLLANPDEVGLLFRDLLINVTHFFRDEGAFQSLSSFVIPRLFEDRGRHDTIRIWIPGCATGEEVYSIAILMQEHASGIDIRPRVQIFASDIDDQALGVARAGRYPKALMDTVSETRRERFFVKDGPSYVVSKDIRDMCIFSSHSVLRDPPFSRIDLVSCRNLLIYLGPEVQAKVLPTFHYALKSDGYLFLGAAENVTHFEELFAPIQKQHRLFRRRSVPTPGLQFAAAGAPILSPTASDRSTRSSRLVASQFRSAIDHHVLHYFAPAHVLVNSEGEIVFYSARTGKYLEMPIGAPTRHLLTLARRDIRLDLQTMLREVLETRQTVRRESLIVDMGDGNVQMVSLVAEPFERKSGAETLYIIVFNDQGPVVSREEAIARLEDNQLGASLHAERDLRDTRERLQSLVEEYETALEELKSSNEELVSINEELQSTNEEMEASKEELQSLNEELHTVNGELNDKVDALDRANSDLVNLFDATDVATVFLDTQLVIRSFTPAVSNVLNIRYGDRGRPVTDLSSRVNLEGLADDIRKVFESGHIIEKRTQGDGSACHYLVRIAPYMDSGHRSKGVVVTFLDVTSLVRSEEKHHMLVAELQHRTRNMLGMVQAIAMRTLSGSESLNAFLERLEAIGRTQSLLGRANSEHLRLTDLLQQEFDAIPNSTGRVELSGPEVLLDFDSAQTLALALHELATNAVKYGALGVDGGRIDVSWTVASSGDADGMTLVWRETGVDIRSLPERIGFGRELIEKALSHTLNATTQLKFGSDGVVCTITIPLVANRAAAAVSTMTTP